MKQLRELARRFPDNQIETKPDKSKASYVTHSVVNERLLYAVGAFDLDVSQIVRGYAPAITDRKTGEIKYEARNDAVVGVVARLTISVDGVVHHVEEVGDVENPAMQGDGANLKNAMSDAIKRCAMRFGLGLHLWSQEKYFLDRALGDGQEANTKPRDTTLDDIPPEEDPFPSKKKAASEEPAFNTITSDDADRLKERLTEWGVKQPLAFAKKVTGQSGIKGLSDLTKGEAAAVFRKAEADAKAESEAA